MMPEPGLNELSWERVPFKVSVEGCQEQHGSGDAEVAAVSQHALTPVLPDMVCDV